ncbi:tripartite tricarboxylate transporter substrate binding protein [Roseomonas sp. OT10]|uniref:Bug family tripartite tricarboxylate transporter substrate binding protein n=1 Tax=Roseomonas cutis TaxID=2897332 RepID=UPI001E28B1F2|nr:tripartite tricarboxylate transporter substrate binding protein [Roseomonas sp. OT10]UFN49270.1 tripartite tricarboxylate transporter substrate binding protein [Roseomonas sp. OT10]
MSDARLSRRCLPALFLAGPALAGTALDRPARIIVGAAPGGGADLVARILAEHLTGRYAPQVMVENRPGASSRLGAEAVKAAAPDGTALLLCPMPVLALFPHVLPRTTRYHPITDFTAAATVGELAYGLVVRRDHPASDLRGFIDWARAKGEVTFAPPVAGAPQHMLGLALMRAAGLDVTVVTYRASTLAMPDLIAGRLDCYMSHMAELAPQIRGGQARLLAVSVEPRLPGFPDVATFAEQGFAQLTASEAFVVMLPAAAPPPVVAALNGAVAAAVAEPAVRDRLAQLQIAPKVLSPAETAARLAREFAAWGPAVRASGFTPEE